MSLADTMRGSSPAHMASAHGRVKILPLIKKVNADLINQRDKQGRTPLLYARQSRQNGAVEWLIEHGAEEAGEALEGAKLEAVKVLSQLIQMHSIISHKALSSLTYHLLSILQRLFEESEESARLLRLASKYCENPDCEADRTAEGFRLKKCPLCMVISYCSEACQHQHWKVHRPLCREFRSK